TKTKLDLTKLLKTKKRGLPLSGKPRRLYVYSLCTYNHTPTDYSSGNDDGDDVQQYFSYNSFVLMRQK
ncbi:hypothetical protein, partial [Bacteroides sp.]|uniref:hypothetical protein n=1 Tax=Bacteroides sp. TaxID=29523 RepID=UPI003A9197D9